MYPAIPPELGTLYTPFEREQGWKLLDGTVVDTHIDYAHEREWRVPGDFEFTCDDIKFLIVETFADIPRLPDAAVKAVGERSIPFDEQLQTHRGALAHAPIVVEIRMGHGPSFPRST